MTEESITISEINTDADDKKEVTIADVPEEIMAIDVPKEEENPQPKKKPGRPLGSKSKEPGKPRAKRTSKKQVEPLETVEIQNNIQVESKNPPRVLEGSRPIPRQSYDETSELLLQLLSHQANQRKRNKVELWKSWFR